MLPVTSISVTTEFADCDGTTFGAGSADNLSAATGVEAGAACCGAVWRGAEATASSLFGSGLGLGAGTGAIGSGFCAAGGPAIGAAAVSVLGVGDDDLADAMADGAFGAVPGEAMDFGSGGAGTPAAAAFMIEAAAVSGLADCCGQYREACSSAAGDACTTGATKLVLGDMGLAAQA
jgi:hypothetical protein